MVTVTSASGRDGDVYTYSEDSRMCRDGDGDTHISGM